MEGRPVVALESTIITHGMAYPQNLRLWILMFLVQQSYKNEAKGNVRLLGIQNMSSGVKQLYLGF